VLAPNRAALYTETKGECRWGHVEWDADGRDEVALRQGDGEDGHDGAVPLGNADAGASWGVAVLRPYLEAHSEGIGKNRQNLDRDRATNVELFGGFFGGDEVDLFE
jgi:hypothetical protein